MFDTATGRFTTSWSTDIKVVLPHRLTGDSIPMYVLVSRNRKAYVCKTHNVRISAAHLGNTTRRVSHRINSPSRTWPSTGSGQGSTSWTSGTGCQGILPWLSSFKHLYNS